MPPRDVEGAVPYEHSVQKVVGAAAPRPPVAPLGGSWLRSRLRGDIKQ